MILETASLPSGVHSRPRYGPLHLDPLGRVHLVLSEGVALPGTLLSDLAAATAPAQVWRVARDARVLPALGGEGPVRERAFRSTTHLLEALAAELATAAIGPRLYAVGSESFLWDVANLAGRAGMTRDEIALARAGSARRRVHCIHCRATNDDVTTSIVRCRGCQADLSVRDHFSRRLAAYIGVQADAEEPGVLPDAETLT